MSAAYRPSVGLHKPEGTDGEAYAASRCIPFGVLERAGVRFAPDWLGGPALVAPVRDLSDELCAGHGRYIVPHDPKCRSEGEIGLGVFKSDRDALSYQVVTLCEGLFDALSLAAAGFPAVALIGLAWRPWLVPALEGRTVNLAFDADQAGDAAARDWEARLAPIVTRRLRPVGGKDWNEELLAGGVDALRDRLIADGADMPPSLVVLASEVEQKPIDWIWPFHLARGKITLIEGDPGKGKGLITMDLAARLSRGGAMPDGLLAPRSRVLFLTGEDDMADTEVPRLVAAGADLNQIHFLKPKLDHTRWDLGADAARIAEEVRFCGADLLVIDPLTEFIAAIDTNRDNEVRGVLARLRDIAQRTRCAVLAVRHLNKGAGASAIYRGSGSIAFTGAARFVFTVGQHPDDPSLRAFAMTKCNVAPQLPTLLYRTVSVGGTARIEWLGPSDLSADQILSPCRDRARDVAKEFLTSVLADGPVAANAVLQRAQEEGISTPTLYRAKQRLNAKSMRTGSVTEWALEQSPPYAASLLRN